MDFFGWFGAIMFAICGIPQAWESAKTGHSRGLNWGFLITWFLGEVCTIIYVIPKQDWPLIFNYIGNFACLLVIIRYKIWERK